MTKIENSPTIAKSLQDIIEEKIISSRKDELSYKSAQGLLERSIEDLEHDPELQVEVYMLIKKIKDRNKPNSKTLLKAYSNCK